MPYQTQHLTQPPSRADVDALPGITLLEFGTPWCGHCIAAQPHIAQALQGMDEITHLKVEDGPGQPLGRSYRVKLWPTLVFLRNGQEVARLVRPQDGAEIVQSLQKVSPAPQ